MDTLESNQVVPCDWKLAVRRRADMVKKFYKSLKQQRRDTEAFHSKVNACVLYQVWFEKPATSDLVSYQLQGRYSANGQCVLTGGMRSDMTGRVFLFFWLNKFKAFFLAQSVALPSS